MFDLTDRVAVVTGVLGKLGPIWARALLEAGAGVAGIDLAGASESDEFDGLLESYGADRLRLYDGDVLDRDSLAQARGAIEHDLGPVSILVNNAGIDQPPGKVEGCHLHEIPAEAVRRVLDVNVVGLLQAAQVFGAAMVERGSGSIINIGSLYASVSPDARFYDHLAVDPPFLKPPAYGASKAAVINLTKYLATHWGPRGVRVNALSPGGVLGGQDEEFQRKFNARVPLGRMAEARDLGGPLVFLASDASSYVNGIELRVDGGYTAW